MKSVIDAAICEDLKGLELKREHPGVAVLHLIGHWGHHSRRLDLAAACLEEMELEIDHRDCKVGTASLQV